MEQCQETVSGYEAECGPTTGRGGKQHSQEAGQL